MSRSMFEDVLRKFYKFLFKGRFDFLFIFQVIVG